MQVVLVMFRPDGERRSFSIVRDMTVIGRREDCDLRIPLGDISRKHCRLIKDGDTLRVEDLGSSNGTYHNGTRVQEAVLQPGDHIQLGPVMFALQIDGVPADDDLQPMHTEGAAHSDTDAAAFMMEPGESGAEIADLQEVPDGQEPEAVEELEEVQELEELPASDDQPADFDFVMEDEQPAEGQDAMIHMDVEEHQEK